MRFNRQLTAKLPAGLLEEPIVPKYLNMSDDKPKNFSKMKGDKKKPPRNRYADAAANSTALQEALDEKDDRHLLDNLNPNPRPGGRPAETISSSAAAMLQTPNETPGMIVGPEGRLYKKSEWKYIKDDYRHAMLKKPLPAVPVRIRDHSPVESSTPEERESWSDEDPAFIGYGELEEEES